MAGQQPRVMTLPRPLSHAPPALLLAADGADTRTALSISDAWEIAMTWEAALRNRVRLVTAHDGPIDTILDSYAWILFTARRTDEEVCVARAAAVAWFLLSCCPGYGGHENPVFWKCVFSALCQSVESTCDDLKLDRDIHSVHDATGFFDQPGHEFPRFMVDAGRLDQGEPHRADIRLFFGVDGDELPPVFQSKLEEIASRLEIFVDAKRLARTPDVCLAKLNCYGFAEVEEHLRGRHDALGPVLQTLFSELKLAEQSEFYDVSSEHATNHVRFRLQEIRFSHNLTIENDADVTMLYELMRNESIQIGRFHWVVSRRGRLSASGQVALVSCMLALDHHDIQARMTTIQLISWDNPVFTAFVSAIPFARSMHTLRFSALSQREAFDDHDLPWLAYAVFHPDADSSSWRSLHLEDVSVTRKSIAVIDAMALGNNLLALLSGSAPRSDAYYRAKLIVGKAVRAEPQDDAAALAIGDCIQWVDVCVSSLDPATWDTYAAVVVPAQGLGWVRSQDLQDIEARAPSQSTLTALTFYRRVIELDSDTEVLAGFVSLLGSRLQYLNIEGYCEMRSVSCLHTILTLCPALEVLEVGHSGELWSSPSESDGNVLLPRLKQLHLHLAYPPMRFHKPSLTHLQSSLLQLEALRVEPEGYAPLVENHDAVEFVLSRAHKLRVFHWASGLPRKSASYLPTPYTQTLEMSMRQLKRIKSPHNQHLYVERTADRTRVAAFLSVVGTNGGNEDKNSAVGQLDVDSLKNVFQFVVSQARRVVVIELSTNEMNRRPVVE